MHSLIAHQGKASRGSQGATRGEVEGLQHLPSPSRLLHLLHLPTTASPAMPWPPPHLPTVPANHLHALIFGAWLPSNSHLPTYLPFMPTSSTCLAYLCIGPFTANPHTPFFQTPLNLGHPIPLPPLNSTLHACMVLNIHIVKSTKVGQNL